MAEDKKPWEQNYEVESEDVKPWEQNYEVEPTSTEKKNSTSTSPVGGKVGASATPSIGSKTYKEALGVPNVPTVPTPLVQEAQKAGLEPKKPIVEQPKVQEQPKVIKTEIKDGKETEYTVQKVGLPKQGAETQDPKIAFDNYNSTYQKYKIAEKYVGDYIGSLERYEYYTSGNILEDVKKAFQGDISLQGLKQSEEDFKKTPTYESLSSRITKAKDSFFEAKKRADKEVELQSELIAKSLGGWKSLVNSDGSVDVDKIRNGVDANLEKLGIETDSPIAYKLRNEIKGKAEFKQIEPKINDEFEKQYFKLYGVTPESDIQAEYGLNVSQAKSVKDLKLGLEKTRKLENDQLVEQYKPEYEELGAQYKTKTQEINTAIENDTEINAYAESLKKDTYQGLQSAVDAGKMTVEQANQELNNPKYQEELKAKVLQKINEKYGKVFESAFTDYQKQINQVASRYKSAYRMQENKRVEEANKKIEEEVASLGGQYKISDKIADRRKKAYGEAFKAASTQQQASKEAAGRGLNFIVQAGASLLMGLGGGLKGVGAEFDNKTLYDIGESLESNFEINVGESKEFSDWLDSSKLVVGTGNIIGRMLPGMGLTAAAAIVTKDWNLTSRLAATAITGWSAETADMAGTIRNEVFEKTGDPAVANRASQDMWRSQTYLLPLYGLEGAPYISEFYTALGKKLVPKLFAETSKGARLTFGQWAKQTAVKTAAGGIGEVVFETSQEFPQNINEEAIRNGAEIKNIFDQIQVFREGATLPKLKETFVQVAPATFIMGSTPVFVSNVYNRAKEKYYENAVDNYINSESISTSLNTSPEQYLFNVFTDKGVNFTGTLLNTLYTSGNISEAEFDNLSNKMANMEAFKKLSKKANLSDDNKAGKLVGYRLYDQYVTSSQSAESEKDPILKKVAQSKANEAEKELTDFLQGKGFNGGVMTLANGQQFIFTPDELRFALQFENIRQSIKNGEIGLAVSAKKGQEKQSDDLLNELNDMLQEAPVAPSPSTTSLNKNTTPTEERYGTIDRGDGKGIVDLTRPEYEAELAKQRGEAKVEVKPMVTEVQFTTRQRERRDAEIEEVQQLRNDLGQDVELINDLPGFIDDVVDRIDLGMVVAPEMLSDAVKELDKQFDKLQSYRNDPSRTHTTAQIDAMIDVLGSVKSEIQEYQLKEQQNGQETTTKTEPTTATTESVETRQEVSPTVEATEKALDEANYDIEKLNEQTGKGFVSNEQVAESYQVAKAKPLSEQTESDKQLIQAVEQLLTPNTNQNEAVNENVREIGNGQENGQKGGVSQEAKSSVQEEGEKNVETEGGVTAPSTKTQPNEKVTEKENGEPLSEGVQGVRTETEERQTSTELRPNQEEVTSTTELQEKQSDIKGYDVLKQIEKDGNYIKTDETIIDNSFEPSDAEYQRTKAYKVEYVVKWMDTETSSDPDVSFFKKIDDAYDAAQYEGQWWSGNIDHTKSIEPVYKEVWLDKNGQEYEETGAVLNGDEFSDTKVGKDFIKKFGFGKYDYVSEVYVKNFGKRDSNARELERTAYNELGGDLETTFTAENGELYTIRHSGNGKYSFLTILDKNENEIDRVQLRISDHTYNPANNDDSARSGKFISVEIANVNPTKNRFNTSYSLQFDGRDTYEDVLSSTKERLNEILENKIEYPKSKTSTTYETKPSSPNQQEVTATINNAVAKWNNLQEATKKSEQRQAAKEYREAFEKMPTVKNVFDNIKTIFAQLEKADIIKTKNCP